MAEEKRTAPGGKSRRRHTPQIDLTATEITSEAPVDAQAPEPAAEPAAEPCVARSFASACCFAAFACSAPNFSSASLESWGALEPSTLDVAKEINAGLAGSLRRDVEAPEPPHPESPPG